MSTASRKRGDVLVHEGRCPHTSIPWCPGRRRAAYDHRRVSGDRPMDHVGILAYGSLIGEPGEELGPLTVRRISDVQTPFTVEFARSSSGRDGAPTLIPVSEGGGRVAGVVLVLDDAVGKEEAASVLWRRETGRVGQYDPPHEVTDNTVVVECLRAFVGIDLVLYTRIGANIKDRRPERLGDLAVRSAKADSGARRRDGISYLIRAKEAGISTPLMPAYERAILSLCGVTSLDDAWLVARSQPWSHSGRRHGGT